MLNSLDFLLSLYEDEGPASTCLYWIRCHHGLFDKGFGRGARLMKPFAPILPEEHEKWWHDMNLRLPEKIRQEFIPVREGIEKDFVETAAHDLYDRLSLMTSYEDRERYVYKMVSCFNQYSHCFQDKGKKQELLGRADNEDVNRQLEVLETLNSKMIELAYKGYDDDRFDVYDCPIETFLAHYWFIMRSFAQHITPVLLAFEIDIEDVQRTSVIYMNVELSKYDYCDGKYILSADHAKLQRQKIANRSTSFNEAPVSYRIEDIFNEKEGGIGGRHQFWILLIAASARGIVFNNIPEFINKCFATWNIPYNKEECLKSTQDTLKGEPWTSVRDHQSMVEFVTEKCKQRNKMEESLRIANKLFVTFEKNPWG